MDATRPSVSLVWRWPRSRRSNRRVTRSMAMRVPGEAGCAPLRREPPAGRAACQGWGAVAYANGLLSPPPANRDGDAEGDRNDGRAQAAGAVADRPGRAA